MDDEELRCDRCGQVIRLFDVHVRLRVQMLTGDISLRRYCPACCADPAMAVLFSDVCSQPVKEIVVRKAWA